MKKLGIAMVVVGLLGLLFLHMKASSYINSQEHIVCTDNSCKLR